MIIKIIPENEEDRRIVGEEEFHNVKTFFMFGAHRDADDDLKDFHCWYGDRRYLCGSMSYFLEVLHDERREIERRPVMADSGPGIVKHGPVAMPDLKVVEVGNQPNDVVEDGEEVAAEDSD